jgi:dTDP-4-amino-4,6-dideoxygalactose transaminase
MSDWRIPLSDLAYDAAEEEAVLRVLRSRWLTMGAEVEAFEGEFAAFTGAKHAIAVANGTAALHLAFVALGVSPGNEIIQPAINFVAAANMTVAAGAIPVFADIAGTQDPTLDPAALARCITSKTKAAVVMHYGGYLPDMAEIVEICRKRGVPLIEDACHAVGARYIDPSHRYPHGRMTGCLGNLGCFSFFSNKNLAIGEGGMLTTSDDSLAKKARLLRSHGMNTLTWDRHRGHADRYDVLENGFNYRMDEMHAALGRVQLSKLQENNQRRKRLVSEYGRRLNGLGGWNFLYSDYKGNSACHLAVLVAPDEDQRNRMAWTLREERIQTSLHYPYVPDFGAFRGISADCPRSRAFANRAITLPLFPGMTEAQVEEICEIILRSLK